MQPMIQLPQQEVAQKGVAAQRMWFPSNPVVGFVRS